MPLMEGAGKQADNEDDDEDHDENDDGKFWMRWDDFLVEFESLTVCHLDNDAEMEQRAKGTFRYGVNSPSSKQHMTEHYLDPVFHFQIKLTVTDVGLIKFQLLLDCPIPRSDNRDKDKKLVFVAIHQATKEWSGTEPMRKAELYEADLVQPLLPITLPSDEPVKGYRFEQYNYNGWVYRFDEPGDYVLVIGSCPATQDPTQGQVDFLFRARSQCIGNSGAKFELSTLSS